MPRSGVSPQHYTGCELFQSSWWEQTLLPNRHCCLLLSEERSSFSGLGHFLTRVHRMLKGSPLQTPSLQTSPLGYSFLPTLDTECLAPPHAAQTLTSTPPLWESPLPPTAWILLWSPLWATAWKPSPGRKLGDQRAQLVVSLFPLPLGLLSFIA